MPGANRRAEATRTALVNEYALTQCNVMIVTTQGKGVVPANSDFESFFFKLH